MDKFIVPRMKSKYPNYPDFRDKNVKHTEFEQVIHTVKSFFIRIKNKILGWGGKIYGKILSNAFRIKIYRF